MDREADAQVAHMIMVTNMCQSLHCLPSPGGLLDQDPYYVTGMSTVLAAQAERSKKDADQKKALAEQKGPR